MAGLSKQFHRQLNNGPDGSDIYEKRSLKCAHSIINDSTYPAHPLFQLLPSGKCYRTLKTNSV